jgi:hypothetical protein
MLNSLVSSADVQLKPDTTDETQLINARPIGSALFNPNWSRGSLLTAFVRTDDSGRLTAQRHALTLLSPAFALRASAG